MAPAPQRGGETGGRGSNYSRFNYMKVLIVVAAEQVNDGSKMRGGPFIQRCGRGCVESPEPGCQPEVRHPPRGGAVQTVKNRS